MNGELRSSIRRLLEGRTFSEIQDVVGYIQYHMSGWAYKKDKQEEAHGILKQYALACEMQGKNPTVMLQHAEVEYRQIGIPLKDYLNLDTTWDYEDQLLDEIYNADVCDSEPISTVAFMVNDDNDIPDEVKQAFTVFCNQRIASGSK